MIIEIAVQTLCSIDWTLLLCIGFADNVEKYYPADRGDCSIDPMTVVTNTAVSRPSMSWSSRSLSDLVWAKGISAHCEGSTDVWTSAMLLTCTLRLHAPFAVVVWVFHVTFMGSLCWHILVVITCIMCSHYCSEETLLLLSWMCFNRDDCIIVIITYVGLPPRVTYMLVGMCIPGDQARASCQCLIFLSLFNIDCLTKIIRTWPQVVINSLTCEVLW